MNNLQHFIDIKQLDADGIETLLQSAQSLLHSNGDKSLTGKLVANLFFEPSTRTCNSFLIAAKRLGALTISPDMQASSLLKGESLLDTIKTIQAMGASALVIRHHDNGMMRWLTDQFNSDAHIVNAGEGWHQHPTQALLDLMTIKEYKSNWHTLKIAIIGDLLHSRVASSLIDALSIMGVQDIRLVSPEILQSAIKLPDTVQLTTDLYQGVEEVDVIVCLRLQKERMNSEHTINESDFQQDYCVSNKILQNANPDVIVMHPGPMNRNIEIASEVADGPHSVILRQVQNGVAVRMAVLKMLLK